MRGISPISARNEFHAWPKRAVNSPTTNSVSVSSTISIDRTGNRDAPVIVATERIR